ncbi:MAG TPA: oligosaccharide flippase family protein, partial [archaeon]|nr:oligosaccharide flippase family protein [archaeon]
MEVRKKVAKNAFYNTADSLAMMAVGYIFWIIVGKLLQPNEFGIISIIVGLYSLIMPITTLGLSGVLVRFISNLSVESKLEQARYITVASLKVVAALSLSAAVLVFFFSSEIANSIYSNPSLSNPLKILSIMLFFGSLSVLLKGALMGLQRFREMFYFDLFAGSLRLIAVLGLVIMGFGYAGAIFGFAIQFFLLTVIVFYYVFKHLPPVSKKYPTKEVMSYGVAAGLSTVASYMLSQGGIILLGFLGTLEAVAFFNIAVFFGLIIQLSSYLFQTTIAPTISELWAMGDR